MKDSVKTGMNRTGIQMAPQLSKEMLTGNAEFELPLNLDSRVTAPEMRGQYIKESGEVGTIPIPGSLKGAMNTAFQMIKGDNPEVLVDKLGERLAFERTGTRLYEALITKCEAALPGADLRLLYEFRNEEAKHFALVRDVMESLGLDPTAQTPCADTAGVASMGLIQVVNDPRTSVPACVEAILIAELTDNDGWDLLIKLVNEAGLTEVAQKFSAAKAAEEKHLVHIRSWLQELVMKNNRVPVQ